MRFIPAFSTARLVFPLVLVLLVSVLSPAQAQTTATWTGVTDGTWETSTNWSPAAVPNATNVTAAFGSSGPTAVSINSVVDVDGFNFLAGSQAFSFTLSAGTPSLSFNGAGIVNAGTANQTFAIGSNIFFNNSATAGNAAFNNNNGLYFNNSSTAGNATIANTSDGATVIFYGSTTAGSATITNSGVNSQVQFRSSASAGTASITTNNGSILLFVGTPTADSASITNNAGAVMELSYNTAGLGVGSLAGGGAVKLGANALTVGGLNTSTTVSGVIADGGDGGGTGGSLIKTGSGTLTLSGANTYTGATAVNAGSLLVTGSLANTAVSVASGATLGGSGTFAGLTTLASGGILAPGTSPGTITFNAGLTLAGGSILNFELGTTSDLIVVGGGLLTGPSSGTVTLNFSDSGGFGAGTYTLINYATATGTSNFSAGSFSLGSTVAGYNYALGLSGNTLQLTASAIPEPSTYAAIFGAAALGFAMWRRRKAAGVAGMERTSRTT